MRALITGGLGFLGSHLVEALLQDETNEITVVDALYTNPIPIEQLKKEIKNFDSIDFHHCNIKTYLNPGYPKPDKLDVVFHLASIVGPAGVLNHGGKIAKSIINDTLEMAELAKDYDARLIDVSTSEVYGGGDGGLCTEDGLSIVTPGASARKEYAVGKLAAEIALQNDRALDVKIVRPFNIAGPRQSGKGGFVLPRFILQAMYNQPLTVFEDGKQKRAFTDVRDITSALVLLASKGGTDKVYNVGNPSNKCTLQTLAESVISHVNRVSWEIAYVDPKTIYGDSYARAEDKFPVAQKILDLGWKPQYDLDGIVISTREYFKSLPLGIFTSMAREIGIKV